MIRTVLWTSALMVSRASVAAGEPATASRAPTGGFLSGLGK